MNPGKQFGCFSRAGLAAAAFCTVLGWAPVAVAHGFDGSGLPIQVREIDGRRGISLGLLDLGRRGAGPLHYRTGGADDWNAIAGRLTGISGLGNLDTLDFALDSEATRPGFELVASRDAVITYLAEVCGKGGLLYHALRIDWIGLHRSVWVATRDGMAPATSAIPAADADVPIPSGALLLGGGLGLVGFFRAARRRERTAS